MAKYTFPEPVSVQVYDLDGAVRTFAGGPGVVELSDADIALLSEYAPGCATLVGAAPVATPAPAVDPAPAPAPAASSEV